MAYLTESTISATYLSRTQRSPKKVGFVFKPSHSDAGEVGVWTRVTYEEHFDLCRKTAAGILSLPCQIQPEDKIAILSDTRFEWQMIDMAILGCRAVTVPIYASLTAHEAEYILNHSEARVLFVENAKQLKKIEELKAKDAHCLPHLQQVICIEANTGNALSTLSLAELQKTGESLVTQDPLFFENNLKAAKEEDLITICYTSGTTGVPKGAMLSQSNMMAIIEAAIEILGDVIGGEGIVGLTFLPFSHVIGKVESMLAYAICEEQWYAESIEAMGPNMAYVKPEILFGVPRIFEKAYTKILAKVSSEPAHKQAIFKLATTVGRRYYHKIWKGEKPSLAESMAFKLMDRLVFATIRERFGGRLRFSLCGGAPFPKEIGEFFYISGIRVCEGYGLTETCAPVTLNPPENPKFGTVGSLLPGVEVKISPEDGEILLKGRQIFKGYYKNPEATAEVFDNEGWFRTGDIGHLDQDAFLKITDRKKDLLVTSGGKNVAPQKIENLAKTHGQISQFVVHGDQRKYLTALVTLDSAQVKAFAEKEGIIYDRYSELVKNPKLVNWVQQAVNEVNAQLPSFETIKKFTIIPDDFTVEAGELTPSLKVKRKFINQKYAQELEAMYPSGSSDREIGGSKRPAPHPA